VSETETESLLDLLLRLDACEGAREWASTQPDPRTAWAVCQRADWMLWIAAALLPRQIVVLAACDCAETVVHLIKDGGSQMAALLALHLAREWAEGREDPETVRAASDAAYYFYAAAAASTHASRAAAYAANIVHDYAIDAAAFADDAVSYAAAAVSAAACDRQAALAHMVALVRARISADMICASVLP